jgi:small-conductance mechanosensitive channel
LVLHPSVSKAIDVLGLILLTIFTVRFCIALTGYVLQNYWLKKKDVSQERNIKGILAVIKIIIWGSGIVFLLDNLGFKISTVIAGLGIGGVAVALAAQAILGDLLSYFAIFFDRPFELGDFIVVGDYQGHVEHIGIKTTRIRSIGGEQLVFANADLTNARIRNFKRMERRRVVFRLGVTYQATLSQLQEIPRLFADIIKDIKGTIFERPHFFSYADSGLIYEVAYYVTSSDYHHYMDIQQEINLAIKRKFAERGIQFAYPTQTLYIHKT